MDARPDVIAAIVVVGAVAYACRAGGFFLMRYVSLTPAVQAGLQAIPISIVGAILGPVAMNGGPPEWAGIGVAAGVMWLTGRDFLGVCGAIGAVALLRWLGV